MSRILISVKCDYFDQTAVESNQVSSNYGNFHQISAEDTMTLEISRKFSREMDRILKDIRKQLVINEDAIISTQGTTNYRLAAASVSYIISITLSVRILYVIVLIDVQYS